MSQTNLVDFLIGGTAGVISRTATAPIDLYKIQKQNHFIKDASFKDVLKREGVRYLWKGNLANSVKIGPYMAINFAVYNHLKNSVQKSKSENAIIKYLQEREALTRFITGSIGGASGVFFTYPLETTKTRLSMQMNKSKYTGIWNTMRKMSMKEMFGGLRISMMGFGLFNGLNFNFIDFYKKKLEGVEIEENTKRLLCGGITGVTSLTITYPTDLLRRRWQLIGFDPTVPKYNGISDAFKTIIREEGIRGLYRGIVAAQLRIFPTLAIQFWCIDTGKKYFGEECGKKNE